MHRSRFLDMAIALAALLAFLAIVYFPAALAIKVVLIVGLSLIAMLGWNQLTPNYSAIRFDASGEVSACQHHSDSFETLTLLPGATVHHWLTIFRLQNERGQVRTVIATVDSLNAENFRQLRVYLRWLANFSEQDDDA